MNAEQREAGSNNNNIKKGKINCAKEKYFSTVPVHNSRCRTSSLTEQLALPRGECALELSLHHTLGETEGVGERGSGDLLAACSSHLFPTPQTGAKWRPVSKWHSRECVAKLKRKTQAGPRRPRSLPKGKDLRDATACLVAPGRLRLGGQKLTGHISVVTAVAFDGGSRRARSWNTRALVSVSSLRRQLGKFPTLGAPLHRSHRIPHLLSTSPRATHGQMCPPATA